MAATGDNTWSSGWTFILASIGAAVGLGNIWKFPYVVGVNGGGAFVIIYLVCVVFIAIPILIAEIYIGAKGHHSPPMAMAKVATDAGRSSKWRIVAWLGVLAGYLIVTYYSVIAGWTMVYTVKAATGFGGAEVSEVAAQFDVLQAEPMNMALWHTIFMILALFIVGRGLHGGIEKTVNVLMPTLFAMLLVMIGYAAIAGDFGGAISFLFSADFSKINFASVLTAIGQAFFSIGVAMGLMMAYGAYVPKDVSLTRSAVIVAGADTLVALLAGLMIFPIVFANGLDPAQGPSLIFRTLPTAFVAMPGGQVFGALFFLLLVFAAITSAIALLQGIISYAEDKWEMSRRNACILFGFVAWLIGLGTVFSFNSLANFAPLGFIGQFEGATIFALIDYFTANIMMPLGGILIALFVGWRLSPDALDNDMSFGSALMFKAWLWMIRVIAPIAILLVLIVSITTNETA